MSKEMVKKLRGLSWTARISLILVTTALVSLFVYQGWKAPADVDAASIGPNAGTNASGTNWTTATNVYTQNAVYASYTNTAQNNLIIKGFGISTIPAGAVIDGVTVTAWGYGSGASAARRTIRANLTTDGTNAAGTWKTQALTTSNASYALGGTADKWGATLTPALINSANFGVLISDNDTTADALYIDYVTVSVSYTYDATAPTIGTVNVTPTASGYTNSSPTITASISEPDSTVTGCEYTTNGSTWVSGTLSGTSPTWTCTATPSGLSGALTINVRATSLGGTGTGTAATRTVDATGPTDNAGSLVVAAGDLQNVLTWGAASDPSGVQQYNVRFVTGSIPPATCADGTSLYTGTNLTYPHTGLTNGQAYAYRVCASDNLGNVSTGLTGTATPTAGIPNAVSATSATGASAATESATNVLMQRLTVNSDTVSGSDNKVVLSSLTLDDAGTATQVAAVKIYADDTSSPTLPSTAVLIGGKSRWDGAAATIALSGGAAAKRSVTAGTPKYLYIVYDMAFGQTGKTVQSHVTNVGVASPDTSATVNLSSSSFTLSAGSSLAVVTSCSGCHAYPPADSTGAPATRNVPVGSVVGSHAKHGTAACATCHVAPATTTSADFDHRNQNIDFIGSVAYTRGTSVPQSNDINGTNLGSCSTASCHDAYGTTGVATPKWGTAATCSSCHEATPGTGSHTLHMGLSGAACNQCHAGAVAGSNGGTGHMDNTIDVTGGYPADVAKHAAGTYTGSCSTASCHANVYGTGTVATPVWGTPSGCEACHTTPIAATGPATGSHASHNEADCSKCHAGATNSTTTPTLNHADGDIDVSNGYPANVAKHTTASGFGGRTCSTASCHANVYGTGTVTSPAWGTTAGCEACHTTPIATTGPATGSHAAHNQTDCSKCHAGATNSTTSPTLNHADGDIDVTGGYPANVAKHAAGTYTGTCSTASCHANVYGTGTVPTPVWGTSAGCEACHTTPIAATGPATGSHAVHNQTDCSKCHAGATNSTTNPTLNHADGDIDVTGGYPANVAKHTTASGFGGRTCSTASCHANVYGTGTVTSPAWGATAGCEACHTTPIAATGPATGSHAAHNLTDCSLCHAGATNSTTMPTLNHVDGDIDATGGYPANVAKHAAGTYTGTCSTASCHANVYGTGTVTTPAWGSNANCSACHTAYPITATGPATGSHATHMGVAGVACTNCHAAGTTATTAPSTGHNDGNIDTAVASYPTNITKHAAGTGYATASCSTASCHGTVAKTWGVNTTNASCTKCHGKGVVLANYSTTNAWQSAPGYATSGTDVAGQTGSYTNGVSNDAQVGAHDAHLRSINGYTDRQIVCTDCHTIPTSANHANGVTDYAWSNLAKNVGTSLSTRGTLIPGYSTGTCSTNYCHGGVLNGGSDTTPGWSDTAYLTAYVKNATACGKCHGAPPTSGATLNYNHNGVTITSSCTGCHGHEGNGPKHIDGTLQATGGTCDSCHSYDTVGGVWGSGTRLDGSVAEGWGAHARHIDHLKSMRGITLNASTDTYGSNAFNAVCGVCHTRAPANHTLDNSSARFISISTAYQSGASVPAYLGVSGTPSTSNPKTCSNIACHFNASPRWQ